jgi:hypothetical protein
LAHHSHTGKRLSHHHTSYGGIVAVFLVLLLAIMAVQKTVAADYTVNAKIPAPIPSTPAEIDSPVNGARFASPGITVEGSCEVVMPPAVVTILRSNVIIGSANCDVGGRFLVNVTLVAGENILMPQIVSATEDLGPAGQPVTVYYDAPVPPAPSASTGSGSGAGPVGAAALSTGVPPTQLGFQTEQYFITVNHSRFLSFAFMIAGGQGPYTLTVQYDGKTDTHTYQGTGQQLWTKEFSEADDIPDSIRFTLRDASGQTVVFDIAVVNLTVPPLLTAAGQASGMPTVSDTLLNLQPVWIAYSIASGVVIMVWALHHIFWTPQLAQVQSQVYGAPRARHYHTNHHRRA